MSQTPKLAAPTHQTATKFTRPRSCYMRILPATRREIERMARDGFTDADISRQCAVSPATAHKYATPARPKPDYHVHLDERKLRIMARLAEMAVEVRCNRCRILVLGFMFLPITRCTRCGSQIAIPLTVGSV